MHLSDRLDKKQLTTAFLTAGDINPTPEQLKQVYPIWWANVRKDGGLRLTDDGFKFVINHLKLVNKGFEKYKDNLLGVISDVSYFKGGKRDSKAGFELLKYI